MHVDLEGPAGRLEALLDGPRDAPFAAAVCHPHPQFGGTMHTHAVYRLAKAIVARGGAALRFNYRGVGRSAGTFDGGRGEALDAWAALDWLAGERPDAPLLACGFSFGASMALIAAEGNPRLRGLMLAGVALRAEGLEDFRTAGRVRQMEKAIAVIQAEHDPFGAPGEIDEAMRGSRGARYLAIVRGASHLFVEDLPGLQREAEAAIAWLLERAA